MWKLRFLVAPLVAAPIVLGIWPELALKVPVIAWAAWGIASAVVVLNWSAMREAATRPGKRKGMKYADVAAGLGIVNLLAVLGVMVFLMMSSGGGR